mmetsp:Transcript_11720/g.47326  ORF Transcript_11720/g.47326 Transcript_11720/m.47326 type:complete len:209 (-) Transcript_11720:1176-1802(-)
MTSAEASAAVRRQRSTRWAFSSRWPKAGGREAAARKSSTCARRRREAAALCVPAKRRPRARDAPATMWRCVCWRVSRSSSETWSLHGSTRYARTTGGSWPSSHSAVASTPSQRMRALQVTRSMRRSGRTPSRRKTESGTARAAAMEASLVCKYCRASATIAPAAVTSTLTLPGTSRTRLDFLPLLPSTVPLLLSFSSLSSDCALLPIT